jgi:hypothetical protein
MIGLRALPSTARSAVNLRQVLSEVPDDRQGGSHANLVTGLGNRKSGDLQKKWCARQDSNLRPSVP